MAKKPGTKAKARKTTPGDPRQAIIDAALGLAAQLGWSPLRLDEIAERAGLDMVDLYRILPSKTAIVGAYMQRIDEAVAKAGPADRAEPVKDRLFEIIMRRFDALQSDRDGVAAICRDLRSDPLSLICLFGRRTRSLNWMLELSGLGSDGFKGRCRARGLELVMLATLRVWLDDDSRDMSATMAQLDRQLARIDRVIGFVRRGGRREAAPA
jgi:AcrR family transcriptional regulator